MTPKQQISYIEPAIHHLRDDTPCEVTNIEVARLAFELWEQNDRQNTSPEDYWLEAEYRLRNPELILSHSRLMPH